MPSVPDPSPVLDLLSGFRQSAVLFAAVHLGLFDRLERGPADAATLAHDLSCHADGLERLLDALAGLGLLTAGPTYALTPTAQTYLTRSSPRRLTGYILYSLRALWPMWGHLADAVREGSNRWKQTFGLEGPLFANFFRTDEDRREFLLGMHGFGQISSPHLAEAFDLSRFTHLVDLGGATGHLAVACCRRWPNLRATVSDLPAAVPLALEMIAQANDVAPRIDVVANDFFTEPLPAGDLYAVGRILHDWGEDKIHALLNKIAAALPVGGGLLIGEKLLDDDRTGPSWAQLQSLNMLVCAEGKERTFGEYCN
ncbi:MAG: methyltransferase, partial [Gemmataceae bacterium]